jgi:beta-galactosidase/beta-glucuronidase
VNRWVVDLNGSWRFSTGPAASFHRDDLDSFSWTEVQMPNELEMEGISARSDVEYLLRRTFKVPQDFAGRAIIVRFDGVYSHARVWINGHYVREHHGGFTSWDCEITPYVKAGERAELVILLVDRSDDPSGASEYAKHSIAGILRDVSLLALPPVHVQHLHISASLDDQYLTGLLDIQLRLSQATAGATSVSLSLRDPRGALVPLRFTKPVRTGAALKFEQIRIPHVQRWDAEHPYLHELLVELQVGDASETIKRSIGFRRVERVGNRLFVNGEPVVLRGICRHDIHPTRGRAALLQNDERDPALLRKANINFVRTSHYPPTETFLAASSVILWSLGNESTWGPNFKAELKRVREVDSSRPVIFSWSETLGEDRPLLDVYSSHYPVWDGDLGGNDFPVLHDEFAHVACYNTDDLRRDPGVRNFWGHSLAIFGQKFLNTRGCLGGASGGHRQGLPPAQSRHRLWSLGHSRRLAARETRVLVDP